jgi:transcriptional regulator with XRE-family HTH domain
MKTTKARKYNSKILEKIFADISKSEEKQVNSTMIIAALIDDEMKRKNLSVDDMAKLFKVKSETIENWLGGSMDFKISLLCKIEEKLDIKLFSITPYVKDKNVVIGDKALTPAGDGHIVIGHKALTDHGINSAEFTTKKLKEYIKMGYIPRMDGSITASRDLTCNCCAKKTPHLIILEYDYPTHPDVGLCSECFDEYIYLVHHHE